MHPLVLFFLRDFCKRQTPEWDLDWLVDCMDPDGAEWMPESTALELEEASSGVVPVSSWPRLKPEPRLVTLLPTARPPAPQPARKVPGPKREREGRPATNPSFPMYAWLAAQKGKDGEPLTAYGFCKGEDIAHQRLSYYIAGKRAITLELAKRWATMSQNKVPWTCWPLVRDPKNGWYWSYGQRVEGEALKVLRDKLMAVEK